eukprot:82651-Prymnesium_polylepis.2
MSPPRARLAGGQGGHHGLPLAQGDARAPLAPHDRRPGGRRRRPAYSARDAAGEDSPQVAQPPDPSRRPAAPGEELWARPEGRR